MKCPLRFTLDYSEKGILSTPVRDCLKEECAWWDSDREMCRVIGLDYHIALLTKVLLDIRDKMPTLL